MLHRIKIPVMVSCALLSATIPSIRSWGENSAKAESANSSLKNDMVVMPDDSKRVRKDRKLLYDAYRKYVKAFNEHGHGSKQAMTAAKKVMTIQAALHDDLAYHKARQARLHKIEPITASTTPVATPAAAQLPDDKEILPDPSALKNESGTANSAAEDYYNEVVKQFGAESPQAQAVKNQMDSKP